MLMPRYSSMCIFWALLILIEVNLVYSSWDLKNNTCNGLQPNELLLLKGCKTEFDSENRIHSVCVMYCFTQHYSMVLGPWKDVFLLTVGLTSEEPVHNISTPTCLYMKNLTMAKFQKPINYDNYNDHFTLWYFLKDDFVEIEELFVSIDFHKKRSYGIAISHGNCSDVPNHYKQNIGNEQCNIYIQAVSDAVLSVHWNQYFSPNYTLEENVVRLLDKLFFFNDAVINHFKIDFAPSVETPKKFFDFVAEFNVTKVDLSKNHFQRIDKDQCPDYFPSVMQLDFSNGEIETIESNALEGFTLLRELNLSYNKLKSVPNAILVLPSLKVLDISNNNVTNSDNLKIPSKSNLSVLKLRGNYLVNLNSFSLSSYPKLLHLDLSQCSLVRIFSDSFNNCKFLEYLDLSHNHLKTLPQDMFLSTPSLKELNLAGNFFANLPVHILKSIIFPLTLDISHNFLTNISDIGKLMLENLYVSYNNIREWEIPIIFPKIKNLDLRGNQIAVITQTMSDSFIDVRVKLNNNPFDCTPCSISHFYHWYMNSETNNTDFVCSSPSEERGKIVLTFSSDPSSCHKNTKRNEFFIIGCLFFVIGILSLIVSVIIFLRTTKRNSKNLITNLYD